MSSEDSDDEPLSVLASKRREFTEISELEIVPIYGSADHLAKLTTLKKECDVSIKLQPSLIEIPIVERPADVWMYVTDLNPCGPYSCLLCSEWFINKTRIVIHYVVDHKKDYCGICRYFVANREAWWEHLKFHTPWKCSQCDEHYITESELREHLSSVHKLVHCRFCYLRLPDNEHYRNHLYQKHCVSNIANICGEIFWDFEYFTQKFLCLLCSKKHNVGRQFADHYISYHRLTLRSFMFLISGIDLPFSIKGVELTRDFIETELQAHNSLGYVDLINNIKIKQEAIDEVSITVDCDVNLRQGIENDNEENVKLSESMKGYKGEIDFDVTFMELIILQPFYFNYVQETLSKINANIVPCSSEITYLNGNVSTNVDCCLCRDVCTTANSYAMHMSNAHSVRTLPIYWCRVCAAVFDTLPELESHMSKELGEFEDLWICQFCDKEFDSREQTREHLTEHFDMIEYDNCFSPHLGFKCKYCPTLFWNETDRETHHVRVHFPLHKADFYKCLSCDEVFSDKVFFVHHYVEKHSDNNTTYLLKCCMCSVVLQDIVEIRNHFKDYHPSSRRIYCTMEPCKFKLFSHRKALLLHFKAIHDPASRLPVTCSTCGLEFNNAKALTLHTIQAHGPAKFKCTLCSQVLHTSDERKIHYLISHPGRFQYQCDLCDKSFQYRSSLYMHKQEHSPNKKDYTCGYCGKVFMKRDSYREHLQIHEAPRHACSYCPMRFVQRSNMLRHERIHTGERPYTCKYCPRTFADKGACTSHSRTHLNRSSYACMYCEQTFAQKPKLKYHIRKHTGENLETCTLCSKKFTSPGALREHLRVHQRKKMKKTVQCPLCSNMYPTERDMIRHMRGTHTNARFKCPLCRKVVSSAGSLREHVVTHGKVKPFKCKVCPKSYHTRKSIFKHLQSRHGIKRQDIKPYYRHLDPKECNLDLDDDVIDKIFGNLQNKRNVTSLLADFVYKDLDESNNDSQQDTKETDTEENSENVVKSESVVIKIEPQDTDDTDEEIPPPDFVNVKIECVEENEME